MNLSVSLILLQVIVTSTELCEDSETTACSMLASLLPNMCSDQCLSSICKRTCNLCPRKCYSCTDISHPASCNSTIQCPSTNYKCISAHSFAADFSEVYKLGCAPSTGSVCSAAGVRCCDMDLCNRDVSSPGKRETEMSKHHLGEKRFTQPACADIDNLVCSLLFNNNPNMCTDHCISTAVCPKLCGKCSKCYECDHVTSAEVCNTTRVCDPGHICYGIETVNFNLEHGYRLGCVHQNVCNEIARQAGNIFGKRSGPIEISLNGGCCHGDLCNHHKLVATTPLFTTTTAKPTLSAACQYRSGCPHGFDYEEGKCYLIGDKSGSWSDGQKYCADRCSHLAEFNSEHEIRNVLSDVHVHHTGSHHGFSHPTVFVGAIDPSKSHNWIWQMSGQNVPNGMFAASSFNHAQYCAATNRNINSLVAVNCASSYPPICQTDRR